ncbi:HK97-gp10 family putative phage morphogenesis protein [Psychrobacter namhaensis]|uniref:HK97-gp10 family putative phage morphogenesis protein n=1 Tax=Psychrobacter namhaensis TaxID=292734 RepID=UPI0018E00211|nr:HK97-gp10 family putative phage morphogenesis protein [Psychrobacter namhaensis]
MARDSGSIGVQGLRELEEKLEGLTNELAGKALYSALNVALTPVVKEAKQGALVASEPHKMGGVTVQPGLLADSIRKKRVPKREMTGELAQGAAVGVYIGKGRRQKLYPRYWHFIENGTSKMAATPFLRPAFDNNINVMIAKFSEKLAKNIDKYTE